MLTKTQARRLIWRHLAVTLSGPAPGCEEHGGIAAMTPDDDCPDCQRIAEVSEAMERECFRRSQPPEERRR